MPSREPIVIVCGADDNYAMPLAVTLRSALMNLDSSEDIVVCVIDGGMSGESRARLKRTVGSARRVATVLWHEPDMDALKDLWVAGHVTAATYFSLLAPEAVPRQHARAIYLDSDVLVVADLAELWEVPLEGRPMMAVQDYLIPYMGWPGGPASWRSRPEGEHVPYVNAGVLVLDLEAWRRDALSERVFQYLRDHADQLTFRDQEGLNAVLAGQLGLLHPKWNVSTSLLWLNRWPESPFKERMRALRDGLLREPAIWHFTGASKPWHADFTHPAVERWRCHRRAAGWAEPRVSSPATDLGDWLEGQRLDDREIASVVPRDASLILVSDSCYLPVSVQGRRALPFLERGGVFRGRPTDDGEAVRELDRMCRDGSDFIAFDGSTRWWLKHYRGFADHLRSAHSCVHESDRVVIFDVRT